MMAFLNLSSYFAVILVVINYVQSFPHNQTSESDYFFTFYPREAWSAVEAKYVQPLTTPVPNVVMHHTYIPGACYTNKDCSSAMQSMQRYHNSLDWGDIGYNFCVGSDGGVYEGRGWEVKGIHAGRANGISLGVCLIGDWRAEPPPKEQLDATKALIQAGVDRGFISPDYKLVGHNQVMSTECPGEALHSEIKTWEHFAEKIEYNVK